HQHAPSRRARGAARRGARRVPLRHGRRPGARPLQRDGGRALGRHARGALRALGRPRRRAGGRRRRGPPLRRVVQAAPDGHGRGARGGLMPLRFDDLDVTDLAARIRARALVRLPRFAAAPDAVAGRPAVDRDDLLAIDEPEAFVRACYRALLRREVDPEGLAYYLDLLRSGRATKLEVIGRIRFSAPGRAEGVAVRGLVLPLALNLSYRVPLAGRFL